MLEKWLETDSATKTWRQLFTVIDSPALSDSNPYSSLKETDKGIVPYSYVCRRTAFIVTCCITSMQALSIATIWS